MLTSISHPRRISPAIFLVVSAMVLIPFSILPAWRPRLFGSDYDSYYALRAILFLTYFALFCFWRSDDTVNLTVGDTSSIRTGYGDPLLTLRAFACAIVLIGHGASGLFAPSDIVSEASDSRFFWLLFPLPWAGVWIFFTLSGYLMGKVFFTGRHHFSSEGLRTFYRNRILRIVPLAFVAIAAASFSKFDQISNENIKHLIALLFFDYDGTAPLSLIGLLWSIATEMQFYLIAPFLALAIFAVATRTHGFLVFAAFLLFGLAYRLACLHYAHATSWIISVYTPLLGNLDLFGMGMITSFLLQKYNLNFLRIIYGLLIMVGLYVTSALCWSRIIFDGPRWTVLVQFFAAPAFCLATIAIVAIFECSVKNKSKPTYLVKKVIASTQIFGTLTYAVYLWHAPIFELYAARMTKPISPGETIAALLSASAIVLVVSWLSYKLIEKPFDNLRVRNFSAPTPAI